METSKVEIRSQEDALAWGDSVEAALFERERYVRMVESLAARANLAYWDERTNRTIAEAEEVIRDTANRELQLLGNDLE